MKSSINVINLCLIASVCGSEFMQLLKDFSIDNILGFVWPFIALLLFIQNTDLEKKQKELVAIANELLYVAQQLIKELKEEQDK